MYSFHFQTGQSSLPDGALSTLTTKIRDNPSYKVLITGHTDDVGDANSNLKLGLDRANWAKELLQKAGIATKRLMTNSLGANQPIASNRSPEGKQKNRRIEILLTTNYKSPQEHQAILQNKLSKIASNQTNTHQITNSIKPQTIIAEQGTQIAIPPSAFNVPSGTAITLKVTEVFKPSDIILHNLSTDSDGRPLISGGMVKVEAFANGEAIQLLANKALEIATEKMQLFVSENINGRINWVQPQALQIRNTPQAPKAINWQTATPSYQNAVKPKKPQRLIEPAAIDSSKLHAAQKRYANLEANPMQNFETHKTKRFLFWKYKVKATEEDKQQHLAKVKQQKKNIQKEITNAEEQLQKLHQAHKNYSTYKIAWTNFRQAVHHRDSINHLNLKLAVKNRHYDGIMRYLKYVPQYKQLEVLSKIYGVRIIDTKLHYQQWLLDSKKPLQKAIATNDTLMVNMLLKASDKRKLMCHIYKTDDLQEAYVLHLKARKRIAYEQRAARFGITVEELIRREIIQKEWKEKSDYVFSMANLGQYVNCDYFPGRFEEEQLVKATTKLPVPLSQTRTMMVFENMNTVVSAYQSNGVLNGCHWSNVPKGEPVKIISLYLDDKGQNHLAIQRLNISEELGELDYQPVSLNRLE